MSTAAGLAHSGLSVHDAERADAGAWVGLFNRAFRKTKDARTCTWKHFDGPHGASITLLARDDRGTAGGAYSYALRRMTVNGRAFTGAQASDAMVDEAFRKRGIFTGLDDAAAERAAARGIPFAFATAGRQSMHGFLGNGWREIGTWRTHVAVLDATALVRSSAGRLKLLAPLAPLLGPVVRLWLRASGRWPRLAGAAAAGDVVRRAARFDERADRLWERAKADLPIAGARDAAWLNWRYADNPTGKHRAFVAERGADRAEISGYVVVEDGGGRGHVVDLLAIDEAAEDALLRAALRHLRDERHVPVAWLSTIPCARIQRLLRRNGLFPHPRPRPFGTAIPFIVRALRADRTPSPDVFLDPRSWYMMDGDRDVEHVSPE